MNHDASRVVKRIAKIVNYDYEKKNKISQVTQFSFFIRNFPNFANKLFEISQFGFERGIAISQIKQLDFESILQPWLGSVHSGYECT